MTDLDYKDTGREMGSKTRPSFEVVRQAVSDYIASEGERVKWAMPQHCDAIIASHGWTRAEYDAQDDIYFADLCASAREALEVRIKELEDNPQASHGDVQ